jgi:5-methylcytosine-specific restriction endonuclease McrA
MPLELTEDEMGTTGWAVTLLSGHFGHGGWTVDGRDGVFTCACGTQLMELRAVGWQDGLLLSDECRRGDHRACDGPPCEDPICHGADVPGAVVLMERRTPLTRTTGLARVVPLRPVSNRRQRENRQRRAMVDRRWPGGEWPLCSRPGCGRPADDLHEILSRARGGLITDEANTVPLCRQCNHDATRDPDDMTVAGLVRHSWDGPPEEVALTCAA